MKSNDLLKYDVSVVIPTIGEPTLSNVIIALNKGTLIPAEIIIAIPKEKLAYVSNLEGGNVKILALNIKGQVKQRIEGFKFAQYEYVLQLDSDIIVETHTLHNLVDAIIEKGTMSAICPVYDNVSEDLFNKKLGKWKTWLKQIYNHLLDERSIIPPGTITKSGTQTWPPFVSDNNHFARSEWLPGGCILHFKQNLCLIDYYPFSGKAYGEDVIHSILLRKRGVKLFISRRAKIKNEGAYDEQFNSWSELIIYLGKLHKIKLYIVKLINGSIVRMRIWNLFFDVKQLFKFLIGKSRV